MKCDLCAKHKPDSEQLLNLMAEDGLPSPGDLSCSVAIKDHHLGDRYLQSNPFYEASLITLE